MSASPIRWAGRFALAAALLSACARGDSAADSVSDTESAFRGVTLPTPLARPGFTLESTDGVPFDFARETAGTLTLLTFGYTHCPDVCPVHLANLSAVLRDLSAEDRARIRVVFVSVDPARDSAAVIRRFLDQFDRQFIGLRGTADDVNAIQMALNLPPATVTTNAAGQIEVGHASQVIAFTPDDSAHVIYPFGTRQGDWAHDVPQLLHGAFAGAAGTGTRAGRAPAAASSGGEVTAGTLRIRDAVVPAAAPGIERAAYFAIENRGTAAEVLLSVAAPGSAEWAMLHATGTDSAGRTQMTMLDSLVIPPVTTITLAPGVRHVMLAPSPNASRSGDALALQLTFRRAGVVTVPARIVPPGSVAPGAAEAGAHGSGHTHGRH